MALSSPLTLYIILPSLDQTLLKPSLSLASYSFATRSAVKLSIMDTFVPFSDFLLIKFFLRSSYRTNLSITGRTLADCLGGDPIRWVLSISADKVSKTISSFTVSITKESVSSLFPLAHYGLISSYPLKIARFLSALCFNFSTLVDKETNLLSISTILAFLLMLMKFWTHKLNWICQDFQLLFAFNFCFVIFSNHSKKFHNVLLNIFKIIG